MIGGRDDVIRAARRMHERGLVVGSVGNVSRRDGTTIRITPTATPYDRLRRRDLVTVGLDGTIRGGHRAPSRELPLHLAIYRACPDAGAVVHTHSPYATAWSFRGEPLTPQTEDIGYYAIGDVRCAAPAAPGSRELADGAAAAIGASRAVLLGGHGVLTTGATPAEAVLIAEVVEHQAQVAWLLAGGERYPRVRPASSRRVRTPSLR